MEDLLRKSKAIDVLLALSKGPMKVTDIHIACNRCSLPILETRLRELREGGYIRQVMLENPHPYRKEYELTPDGEKTVKILQYMDDHFKYDKLSVGKKMLLLILGRYPDGVTATQMQKFLFLLREEQNVHRALPGFYDFTWYTHGPYNVDIVRDAEKLEISGLVETRRETLDVRPDGSEVYRITYTPTGLGKDAVEQIAKMMTSEVLASLEYLDEFKRMGVGELVDFVHAKYEKKYTGEKTHARNG